MFTNKVFIITGATRGMGLATTKRILDLGGAVVMVYLSNINAANDAIEALAEHKGRILPLQADICKASDRELIVSSAIREFGQIDVLVNNAGIPTTHGFLKEEEEEFDRVLDVNLKAPIFLAKIVAKKMIAQGKGGSIINFASTAGHRAGGALSYAAAKSGIIRATESMASALGKFNIRVNSISPGTHRTDMNRYHWENNTERFQKMVSNTALKRAAEASEITGTVVYLASDMASYTTGIDILVHGGR
jgi:NAD(P)-dependent dehydrogenase (short-subunit alcohol dehydrogenase family)